MKKLKLNKVVIAELNKDEQGAIFGGLPLTVTCNNNTMCGANVAVVKEVIGLEKTLGTECARSYIGEANCNGGYTFKLEDHSCKYGCNTNKSICVC